MKAYTYILRCSDGTLYTGYTTELEKRVKEHNSSDKGAKYTKARRPCELVYYEAFEDEDIKKAKILAMKREWFIKNKMTKKEKETMIMKKIHTDTAPAAIGPYSQGIISGNLFFSSGQIAIDPEVGDVTEKTIEGQTRQVMKNLGEVLKAAGCTYESVIKTTCFLADMDDFSAFNEIYGEYFTGKPARSCVAVLSLPKGVLCEVEVIAELN
ncbi:MAG: GIY-YIG nuclease family protein [Eubacterium sp.]|nr:GIY-YIG nuclease family protein [Eubacterium sp.]